ncbi:lipoyl(octanoyl) transferase LipB [Sulfuriferula sp.]|uniref:lipoyl(octanoyl) transferase LipB n=1 Tax=Sulfuriferula sp. TaxID=2025307 RepID=UPI0027304298|nr:lipoyl(octanoyl) transferase LipB [Sulfuriferula sp.]MDP2024931.1 lipoyl(octanoyl) transferase LipB [Sulfuriferula sp.]
MAPLIRSLGLVAYEPTWRAMQAFTAQRDAATSDEIWLLQHPPIFTLGQAGKTEHLLHHSDIPLLNIDRGGQITYHAPGQLVAYLLIDLKRRNLSVRELVSRMEQAVIDLLDTLGVVAQRRADAPGVYVQAAKIAALGLRIRHGCSYHGLALNVEMDLTPFGLINPCGYAGLAVTQTRDLGITASLGELEQVLSQRLSAALD